MGSCSLLSQSVVLVKAKFMVRAPNAWLRVHFIGSLTLKNVTDFYRKYINKWRKNEKEKPYDLTRKRVLTYSISVDTFAAWTVPKHMFEHKSRWSCSFFTSLLLILLGMYPLLACMYTTLMNCIFKAVSVNKFFTANSERIENVSIHLLNFDFRALFSRQKAKRLSVALVVSSSNRLEISIPQHNGLILSLLSFKIKIVQTLALALSFFPNCSLLVCVSIFLKSNGSLIIF